MRMPMYRGFNIDLLTNPDLLDRIVDWKLGSPQVMRKTGHRLSAITEGKHMQRQFTIELRVDYEDNEKNDAMRQACAAAARHVYATASLLADGIKPQVVVYSDDYMQGHEEIKLLEDTIQSGIDSVKGDTNEASGEISSELFKAVRDS